MGCSGDSVSSFNSGRNIYTANYTQYERLNHERCSEAVRPSDTMEPPRERFDRQRPLLIEGRGDHVTGDRVMKIARAGRYLILAVALPPYCLLYALPKWVLTVVLPKLSSMAEQTLLQLQKVVQRIAGWMGERLNTPFRTVSGWIRWARERIETRGQALSYQLRRPFIAVRGWFIRAQQSFEEERRRRSRAFARRLAALKQRLSIAHLFVPIERCCWRVRKWLQQQLAALQRWIKEGWSALLSRMPTIQWVRPTFKVRIPYTFPQLRLPIHFPRAPDMRYLRMAASWPRRCRDEVKSRLWKLHWWIQDRCEGVVHYLERVDAVIQRKKREGQMRIATYRDQLPTFPSIERFFGSLVERRKRSLSRYREAQKAVAATCRKHCSHYSAPLFKYCYQIRNASLSRLAAEQQRCERFCRVLSSAVQSAQLVVHLFLSYSYEIVEEFIDDISRQ